MKILKQLSKFFLVFFILSIFIKSAVSNEPVDIWNIEKKENVVEETLKENNVSFNNENVQEINTLDQNIIVNDSTGLNEIKYSGHSLRSGFATATAQSGAQERDIMTMTGHKTTQMVRRYIKEANIFKNNALNKIKI